MKLLGGVETGNESGIGFEDDLSSTNFFLGRIKFGWRPFDLLFESSQGKNQQSQAVSLGKLN